MVLNIQRQPGQRDRGGRPDQALLPQLQSTLPGNLDVQVLTDRTTTIRASVKDVQFELALAAWRWWWSPSCSCATSTPP